MPGGLLERSAEIYSLVGGKLKQGPPCVWEFPSGAKIELRYLQYDKDVHNFQGSEIPLLCFDECSHFTAHQFWYLLSRNRSMSGVRGYVRATLNPDPDSFVASLVDWWLGEDGYFIPERAGKLRWFIRYSGELHWADSPLELRDRFPDIQPKSLSFIPALITDNPILLSRDSGYLANLQALHPVDRARLLEGNWKVREEAGKFISRDWFEIVDDYPPGQMVRFWDFASTEKHLKNNPDYTAGVKMLRTRDGVYYVLDVIAVQISAANVNQLVTSTANQDGKECKVRWEIEPGAAGKINSATLTKLLSGFDAGGVKSQGDKMVRARPFATSASNEQVKLVRSSWCDRYLAELHAFPDGDHDDLLDASSGAYNELSKAPKMQPPQYASFATW